MPDWMRSAWEFQGGQAQTRKKLLDASCVVDQDHLVLPGVGFDPREFPAEHVILDLDVIDEAGLI